MHKVIKIFSKLILSAILLVIIIPLILSVLLTTSVVQNRVVDYATNFASEFLETRVGIKTIQVSSLGQLRFEGVYVEDYSGDTLLYAKRLDVNIQRLGLASRDLRFGRVRLQGGELNLRQMDDSLLNIKHIIERLTPKTPAKRRVKILFEQIQLSEFNFRLERLAHRNPEFGVDYGDMELLGLTADVQRLAIEGSNVRASIRELTTRERSGFEIASLRGEFNLAVGEISFTETTLESRYSYLHLPRLRLCAPSWAEYKSFIQDVTIEAEITGSTLYSDDVSYFAPALRNWGIAITDLDMNGMGQVDDLSLDISRSVIEQGSALAVSLHVSGLPDIKKSYFCAQIHECITTPSDIDKIYYAVSGKRFAESVASKIDKLGELRYSGGFDGTTQDFIANFDATSALGVVKSTIQMDNLGAEGHIISGDVVTTDFNVGLLFDTEHIGLISLETNIESDIKRVKESAIAYGNISHLELRGQDIYDVEFHGEIEQGDLMAEVRSKNRGLDFELSAIVDMGEQDRGHELILWLNDIDLNRLGVNQRDSISQLSAKIEASLQGHTIEDLVGEITMHEGAYAFGDKRLASQNITLYMQNEQESKYFELSSEYADLIYRSTDSYHKSWEYLRSSMGDFMPALYCNAEYRRASSLEREDNDGSLDNNSIVSLEIKDIELLSEAFVKGLHIAHGSRADLMFNATKRDMSLSVRSQYIELNSTLALDVNLDIANSADSLALSGSIEEMLVGMRQFDALSLRGGARDNIVRVEAGYSDAKGSSSANISAVSEVSYSPKSGRQANIQLLPSQISQESEVWDIGARNILITKDGLDIDHFRIRNTEQELLVDGLVSRSERDTLRVNMRNFDLSVLSSVTKAIGYDVEGHTSGEVVASSALYNMRVEANVLIDSASMNSIPAPPLMLLAQWDTSRNRADISLSNRVKQDTLIRGYYIPSEVRYFAQVDIDSLNLGLLDAPLKGVLTNTSGYVHTRLRLNGLRRDAELAGYIDVNDLSTRVGYTNVTYRLPKARIDVQANELKCQDVPIYDTLGGSGRLNLNLSLMHLSNISYSVGLSVENILALNTTPRDSDLFYGGVFTTGYIDIRGNRLGVDMDIRATTTRGSEFFLPLSNKSNISTAEFIKFVSPQSVVDTTDVRLRRRLQFEAQQQRKRRERSNNLNINMALNITPEANFQLVIDPTVGDVIRGRGEGQLNLRINPKDNIFEMYGDYTITEGSYLFTLRNIINKRFVISPGSTIQWSGNPLDANLNIEAVYKLKASLQPLIQDESTRAVPVDCSIILSGQLLRPDVSFDISLPSADPEQEAVINNLLNDQETISRQFFYLMLANSFISEAASGSGAEFGVNTTAATGFELLTNQLSNWLSSSNYNVIIRYRPESELAGDEFDLGISHSLINNRLLVEIEGNYTNDTSTVEEGEDPTSNFAGEAYITWLIDSSGALRLRGFTQTIDRFDENQGLQETGIGVYYRESFNNFRDLQQRVKARFSRGGVAVRDEKKRKKTDKKSKKKDD